MTIKHGQSMSVFLFLPLHLLAHHNSLLADQTPVLCSSIHRINMASEDQISASLHNKLVYPDCIPSPIRILSSLSDKVQSWNISIGRCYDETGLDRCSPRGTATEFTLYNCIYLQ